MHTFIRKKKAYKYSESPNALEYIANAVEMIILKGMNANTENSGSSAGINYHFEELLQEKTQVLQDEPLCPGAANCKVFYLNIYCPAALHSFNFLTASLTFCGTVLVLPMSL